MSKVLVVDDEPALARALATKVPIVVLSARQHGEDRTMPQRRRSW
ncbi:hypothetical protein [Nocardioides endophyticus]